MIVLLLVVAAVATFGLIGSSMRSIARVTATDTMSRGRWGVLESDFRRTRRLDAHERRWQTALISGRDQPTRWPDVVAEIGALERAAEAASDPDPPAGFDGTWIDQRLTLLESHFPTPTNSPDRPDEIDGPTDD